MSGMGGYDNDSINVVGPVRSWLSGRREKREQTRQQNVSHAQIVERMAVLHQQNLETMNQGHVNDLERMRTRSTLKRSLIKDAGRIVNQMPADSEIKAGGVSMTRRQPTQAPSGTSPAPGKAPKSGAAKKTSPKAAPQNPAKSSQDRLGKHASGPPPANEPMKARRPGRHARP